MRQVLGAITVLVGIAGTASAAALAAPVAETTSMMLIGAGLVIGASFSRARSRR